MFKLIVGGLVFALSSQSVTGFKLLRQEAFQEDVVGTASEIDSYLSQHVLQYDYSTAEDRVGELEKKYREFIHEAHTSALAELALKNAFATDVVDEEKKGDCCSCTMQGSSHIIQETYRQFEMMCKKTKCPFLKRKCAMAEKDPEFTIGYQIGMTHPFEKAYFYCYGAGRCPHPGPCGHDENGNKVCDTECAMPNNIFNGADENIGKSRKRASILKNMNHLKFAATQKIEKLLDTIIEKKDDIMQEFPPKHHKQLDTGDMIIQTVPCSEKSDGNESNKKECGCSKCGKCIHKVGASVFMDTLRKAAEFCKHTKCPKAKEMCKLAEIHEHIAAGLIWQKLRPMEWSCGFCHGRGDCKLKSKKF